MKKIILLSIGDGDPATMDLTECLPGIIVSEFVEAGGKLCDLKCFGKNESLRFDERLIALIEKHHEAIRMFEGTYDYYLKCLEDPRYKTTYTFKYLSLSSVKTGERFAIRYYYDDVCGCEKIDYFKDFKWLKLPD